MRFLTLDQARQHCKADDTDDVMLSIYIEAAERECEKLANRTIFKNAAAQTTAINAVPAAINAAKVIYDAAILAADALTDETAKEYATKIAQTTYDNVKFKQNEIIDSIVMEDNILNAMLLLIAHWYMNREEVVVGQSVVAIPSGVQSIMYKYRKVGDL